MLKKIVLFGLIFCSNLKSEKINPLSKIVITSQKAIFKKTDKPKNFIFTYLDDVIVTFSDNSKIKSEELEIEIDLTKFDLDKKSQDNKKHNKSSLDKFKKITFKRNVKINKDNKKIESDFAELFLNKKICKFIGNVKIEQIKKHKKDLPINTFCKQAILNMQTEKINFIGDVLKPVSTTIKLAGHPGFLKKVKTKEEKRAEIKANSKKRLSQTKKS
ncbi:hypothetical protein ACFLYH_02160 [Candidatus Dependentiae bacterium]